MWITVCVCILCYTLAHIRLADQPISFWVWRSSCSLPVIVSPPPLSLQSILSLLSWSVVFVAKKTGHRIVMRSLIYDSLLKVRVWPEADHTHAHTHVVSNRQHTHTHTHRLGGIQLALVMFDCRNISTTFSFIFLNQLTQYHHQHIVRYIQKKLFPFLSLFPPLPQNRPTTS